MRRGGGWVVLCGALWLGCRAAPGAQELDDDISAGDMRARISFLASDMLRGRATPSRGLDIAAEYVASEFLRIGLEKPRGGYVQRYQLAMTEMGDGWSLVLSRGSRRAALRYGKDFRGLPWAAGRVEGKLDFVGSRLPDVAAPEGEAAIWVAWPSLAAMPREWLRVASRAGAVGLIFVLPEELGPQFSNWIGAGDRVYELGDIEPSLPAVLTSETALAAAMGRLGLEAEFASASGHRPSVEARLAADLGVETVTAPNVVGMVRGSDARLRDEYVLVSAHMDHLGVGRPVDGDSIYNGADDNASGTAAVLEVAEAVAALERKPRRSVIFLTVSGEERGLLGSAWFVRAPPVPLDRIVANINVDMVGRNWKDTISVIGKPYSSLGALIDSVARVHRPELRMVAVDDQWPGEGFFFRSDHFSFAREGIPAVFFFNGVHEDYHRPSDEAAKIDFAKAARVARLVYESVLAVANAERAPRWDSRARQAIVEGSG